MKLGILGGGQLGMMMCQEAKDLKISTFIFTDTKDSQQLNSLMNILLPI